MSRDSSLSEFDTLRDLLELAFRGELDAPRAEQMNALLDGNLMLQQSYVEYIDLYAQLNAHSEHHAVADRFQHAVKSKVRRESRRQLRWRLLSIGLPVAFALSIMLAIGIRFWTSERTPDVQLVDHSPNLLWGGDSLEIRDELIPGQILDIQRGFVSLKFATSSTVILRGPGTYRYEKPESVSIDRGELLALVPPAGKGFAVQTPDGTIVDLGTEFLVNVTEGTGTSVNVRQGLVHLNLAGTLNNTNWTVPLHERESANFNADTKKVDELPYRAQLFQPFDIRREVLSHAQGNIRFSESAPGSYFDRRAHTFGEVLVIPERKGVALTQDLVSEIPQSSFRIPAGTVVDSYIIHCRSDRRATQYAGHIQFNRSILALIGDNQGLWETDSLFAESEHLAGRPVFSSESDRRAEEIDTGGWTIQPQAGSIEFDLFVPAYGIDQFRVLLPAHEENISTNTIQN
ncbi:FecR family protein [Calycomorphotria hydatis]|uniref:FecR protein n=1 Tax=Calycomorphotria hydatis TaxID=2528027 RepID=A0A517TER9_9PLAN|nr:FecR family protein [Calycomorphotria hydatis]QDT66862.1 FecR protein [Calycomorphotria hydatis]